MPITAFSQLERRAFFAGLLAFFLLVLVLPIIATFLVSLGPRQWLTQYLAPAKQYQFVFLILVGGMVAWLSKRAPIANTIAVAVVGGVCLLLVAMYMQASPHLSLTLNFFWYVMGTVGWCLLGGLGVSLLQRKSRASSSVDGTVS